MEVLKRGDLNQTYKEEWQSGDHDDGSKRGIDSRFLNREQAYEVLYFINQYCDEKGIIDKETALKIEGLIKKNLPPIIRGREEVSAWLDTELSL